MLDVDMLLFLLFRASLAFGAVATLSVLTIASKVTADFPSLLPRLVYDVTTEARFHSVPSVDGRVDEFVKIGLTVAVYVMMLLQGRLWYMNEWGQRFNVCSGAQADPKTVLGKYQ